MVPEEVPPFPPAPCIPALQQPGPQKPIRIATTHFVVSNQVAFKPFQAVVPSAVKQKLPSPLAFPLAFATPHGRTL